MNTKLDKKDREILDILTKDGRESFTKISEKLSFSDTGVKKRLTKLYREGILKVQGNLNLDALHFKACLILLEVKTREDLNDIIDAYESCPYTFLTLELLGSFNLLIGVYGHDIEDLEKRIIDCGPTQMHGVLRSKIILISNFKIPQYLPLKIFLEKEDQDLCGECDRFH